MIYLNFVEDGMSPSGLTKMWRIENTSSGIRVGRVKWNAGWRKYCFFPELATVFDSNCLNEITGFLNSVNEEHYIARKLDLKNET